MLDSNSDPQGITFPIPGNDDAIRAITLYCDLIAGAVLDGISQEMQASGQDIGAVEELPEAILPTHVAQHDTPEADPEPDVAIPELEAAMSAPAEG